MIVPVSMVWLNREDEHTAGYQARGRATVKRSAEIGVGQSSCQLPWGAGGGRCCRGPVSSIVIVVSTLSSSVGTRRHCDLLLHKILHFNFSFNSHGFNFNFGLVLDSANNVISVLIQDQFTNNFPSGFNYFNIIILLLLCSCSRCRIWIVRNSLQIFIISESL